MVPPIGAAEAPELRGENPAVGVLLTHEVGEILGLAARKDRRMELGYVHRGSRAEEDERTLRLVRQRHRRCADVGPRSARDLADHILTR